VAAVVVAAALAGLRGGVSAGAGLAVVVLFFVVSMYLVEVANRVAPSLTLPVGMTVYGVLVAWLGLLAFGTSLPDRLQKAAFAWTVIAAALGWVVAQAVAVWRSRLHYVDVPLPTSETSPSDDVLRADDPPSPTRSVTDTRS
jgi:hypothetical protein